MVNYFINAHGNEIGTFELPKNVKVIMLCHQGAFDACVQNELRLWSSVMNGLGEDLTEFIHNYNSTKSPTDPTRTELCLFTPNHNMNYIHSLGMIEFPNIVEQLFDNGQCPNLEFSSEHKRFRTGVYELPAKFNRVYISDYVSTKRGSRENKIIKAGTIEQVNINELLLRGNKDKITGTKPLNRFEELLLKPPPVLDIGVREGAVGATARRETYLESQGIENIQVRRYFANVMGLHSFIVPDPSTYEPIIDGIDLRTIVNNISEENPDGVITIIVSACRNEVRGHTKPSSGIPLDIYLRRISTTNNNLEIMERASIESAIQNKEYPFILKNTFTGDLDIMNLTYQEWDQLVFEKYLSNQLGGSIYLKKYLKYKNKYNNLKKKYIISNSK